MDRIFLDGEGLGVLFNKAWKRVAARFLFNEDKKWTSGTLHKRIRGHIAPSGPKTQGALTYFLKELADHGLLEREERRGPGARGGGIFYTRNVGLDGLWEHQINRTIQAFVDGLGSPLMFQGSWIYPTGASNIHHLQKER